MDQQSQGGNNQSPNHGQRIGSIVRSALQSGDLSRLSELGPAVQDAVKDIPQVTVEVRKGEGKPAVRTPGNQAPTQPQQNGSLPVDPNQYDRSYYYQHPSQPQQKPRRKDELAGVPKGIFRIVFGVLGMVAFGLCTAAFIALSLAVGGTVFTPLAVGCGVAFVGCAALADTGFTRNKMAKKARQYLTLLARKSVLTFEELAGEIGVKAKKIKKEVRKLRGKGFLPNVRTDPQETMLMLGEDAYDQYVDSQKTQAQREKEEEQRRQRMQDPETAAMETFRNEGVETIRKIRTANEAIPGEEISGKLSRLETTCARIFSYVEAHPDKLPETSKFMDYYLPTTLKLVEKYRQYEELDYQPDNVKETKAQIENSLDTIDGAFKNLLESLYQHETLDVATDIVVLERMLEQEGLTGNKFEIGESAEDDGIHLTTGAP